WKVRIQNAKDGIAAYRSKDINAAIQYYDKYFSALKIGLKIDRAETIKTDMFNKEKDGAEMLLIAFISFDMMKIYDRSKAENAREEFKKYTNIFIDFTKGMKYQPLLAEQVRKFIRDMSGKITHKEEFQNTYKTLRPKVGSCFIATSIYPTDSDQLQILRSFR